MEDEAWFWRLSWMPLELYLLFEGLEKLTEARNVVPGLALGSWEWFHWTPKLVDSLKLGVPRSPVISSE